MSPAHNFFQKTAILENTAEIFTDLFFNASIPRQTELRPEPAQEGSGQHTCATLFPAIPAVSGHSSRPIPQRRLRRFRAIAPKTGSGRRTIRNSVSGHFPQPLPQRRLRRFPVLVPRIAPEALAGTLRAGFSPKIARVLCPGIRRGGKKSDRSLGRDSSLMRIVFRIGLLTRAVQTDNATIFYKTRSW